MKVETVTVTEKELQTVQVNVVDPCQTVRMVSRGRDIKKPRYSVQVDAGGGKVICAVNIFEGDQEKAKEEEAKKKKAKRKGDKYKEGGCRRSIILDQAAETVESVQKVMEPVLPLIQSNTDNVVTTGDCKFLSAVCRVHPGQWHTQLSSLPHSQSQQKGCL